MSSLLSCTLMRLPLADLLKCRPGLFRSPSSVGIPTGLLPGPPGWVLGSRHEGCSPAYSPVTRGQGASRAGGSAPLADPLPTGAGFPCFQVFCCGSCLFPLTPPGPRRQPEACDTHTENAGTSCAVFPSQEIPGPESSSHLFRLSEASVTLWGVSSCTQTQEQGGAVSPAPSPELPPPLATRALVCHLLCSTSLLASLWEAVALQQVSPQGLHLL